MIELINDCIAIILFITQMILNERYERLRKIGQGSYGDVFALQTVDKDNETSQYFALKRIKPWVLFSSEQYSEP